MSLARRFATPVIAVIVVAMLAAAFWPSGGQESVRLTFDGLQPLENGYYYEGWVVVEGEPWSVGQFNVGDDGSLVTPDGEPVSGGVYDAGFDVSASTMYAVTYHPKGDTNGASAPHVLGGLFEDGEAALSLTSPAGIGVEFESVAGLYIMGEGEPALLTFRAPGLGLGFQYEAWVVRDEVSTSIGRFGGGAFHYEGGDHEHDHHEHDHGAVDGEPTELVIEEMVLDADPRGARLMLTLEHAPDHSPSTPGIPLIEARVSPSAEDGVQYQFTSSANSLPTGLAELR